MRSALFAAVLVGALVAPPAAMATAIQVNTGADEYGSQGELCSLREAVQAANTNEGVDGCSAGEITTDLIVINPYPEPHLLTRGDAGEDANQTGDLDIDTDGGPLEIIGTGANSTTIDALGLDRAFDVTGDSPLRLEGVRVVNGLASLGNASGRGGALRWVSTAQTAALYVTDSAFEDNFADGTSALHLETPGDHSVINSRFTGNVSHDHGVIRSFGPIDVARTGLLGNIGGGIETEGAGSDLELEQSAVAGNSHGSQESIGAIDAEGDVLIEQSTIHANTGGFVGGVRALGDLTISFSTITGNATGNAAGDNSGGIDSDNAESVLLEAVILAGNTRGSTPSNCNDVSVTTGANPSIEDSDTCGFTPPNMSNTDPQLDALRENGGLTPTRGLYPESPALDAATACGLIEDQRSVVRDPGACDIGAFEGTVPRPVVTPPVNPLLPPNTSKRCKAKIRRCCTKKQKASGRPKYCRKKKRKLREAGTAAARELIGRSVQGRPLVATRIGDPDGERVALVVGVIHGDERAGLRVVSQLKRRWSGVKGLQLWVLKTLNPDGQRTRSRKNARGVDLNRNFPADWRGGEPESSGYYPGPSPASEPETKAAMTFIERIQPDVSVWYHQPWGAVLACKGRPAIAARYAKLAGMKTSCRGRGLPGTAIGWQRDELEGSDAFVVEFGPGGLSDRAARRHARAAAIIGRDG